MSLVIHISINGGPAVSVITARRLSGSEHPDSVNRYLVQRHDAETSDRAPAERHISHRYGDGAVVLARKALEAITEPCPAGDDDVCGGQGPCDTCPKESA